MSLKIGSLFSGYGGLDSAVSEVTGAKTVWVSDIDKGACKILAHRNPDVPNLGDITTIDWTTVEPIDILTGGFPCQDLSHAGKRAGLKTGTRSGLWSYMAEAVEALKPRLVVVENVRGLLSASAPGDVEPCPWCVGDGTTFDLRALGTVLADLADIGYDSRWCGLRAADVGACHGRFRVFLIAQPADTGGEHGNQWRVTATGETQSWGPFGELARRDRTPLMPTPVVNDMGSGKTVDAWDAWTDDMRTKHGNGNGHGPSLSIEAQRLLPTPMAAEGTKPSNTMGVARREATGQAFLTNVIVTLAGLDETERQLLPTPASRDHKDTEGFTPHPEKRKLPHTIKGEIFGDYAPVVERWEKVMGRRAPSPTEPRPSGRGRLSPAFVEWMMGLPEGWVTDVPGLSWAEQLKALGNGVVPQQAAAALRHMLGEP